MTLAGALAIPPLAASAQDAASAPIVEAMTAQRVATNISDPAERLAALEAVLATLDRIVTEHPTSPLAVQIITEQPIGTLDVAALQAEVAELTAAIAQTTRQAGLPFLEREPPQTPCDEEDVRCILQTYLAQPPVVIRGMGGPMEAALRQASLAMIAAKIAFDDDASAQAMRDRMVDPTRRSGSTREAADLFEAMALRDGIAGVVPSLVVFSRGIVSDESRRRRTPEDAVAALLEDPLKCGSALKGGSGSILVQPVGQIGIVTATYCDGEQCMPETWKTDRLLPSGLVVDDVTVGPDEVAIAAHARGQGAECPGCGRLSRRLHGRYERYLWDVPAHGRRVRVCLTVRRFRCPHGG